MAAEVATPFGSPIRRLRRSGGSQLTPRLRGARCLELECPRKAYETALLLDHPPGFGRLAPTSTLRSVSCGTIWRKTQEFHELRQLAVNQMRRPFGRDLPEHRDALRRAAAARYVIRCAPRHLCAASHALDRSSCPKAGLRR